MKKRLLALSVLLSTLTNVAAKPVPPAMKTLKLVNPVWEGYVNADGSGLYVDLLKLIYEPLNYQISVTIAPFKRGAQWLEEQNAHIDVMIGVYNHCKLRQLGLTYAALTPYYPVANERTVVIYKKSNIAQWHGVASLKNKRVVAIRGYNYDQLLPVTMNYIEVNVHAQAWGMLSRDRTDFYMDELGGIEKYLSDHSANKSDYQVQTIGNEYSFLGFAKNARGQQLAELYDQRMMSLTQTGKIEALYQRHDLPNPITDAQYATYTNPCVKKPPADNH